MLRRSGIFGRAGVMTIVVIGLAVGVACGSDPTDSAREVPSVVGESTTTVAKGPGDLNEVWIDPRDDTHLLLSVIPCVDDVVPSAVESSVQVALSVTATEVDPPCSGDLVDLYLDEPLADRRLTDAEHDVEMAVVPAEFLYPDPASLVVAECTTSAAREAVERNVDGGLRTNLVACDESWMAVDTSTDACAPTEEPISDGCKANQHIVYFRNDGGHWSLAFFDDCDAGRDQFPDFPEHICQR